MAIPFFGFSCKEIGEDENNCCWKTLRSFAQTLEAKRREQMRGRGKPGREKREVRNGMWEGHYIRAISKTLLKVLLCDFKKHFQNASKDIYHAF